MRHFEASRCYFSSDWHLNHRNICRGVSSWSSGFRDFDTVEHMNRAIIDSINAEVGSDDHLFFMGDFNFGDKSLTPDLRARINCRNLYLIYGNHDEHIQRNKRYQDCFSSCSTFEEIVVVEESGRKQMISLFHYPMKVWNKAHKGAYALTGHSHGSLPYTETELGLDVGWDVWRRPLSYDIVNGVLSTRRFLPVDHHNHLTN